MGKRLEPRTYVLHFEEGTYLAGAEIRIRATPVAVTEQLETLSFIRCVPLLLEYLDSWNLEDADGESIKLTEEAILGAFEWPVLKKIIQEWYQAATGVTAPLDQPSSDGQPSPDTGAMEQYMPMEALSASPEN